MILSNNIFIKIDYNNNNSKLVSNYSGAHINCSSKINSTRYLIGGGIYNKNKGNFIFKVKDLEEANAIVNNNFLTKNNEVKYNEVKCNFYTIPTYK